jgi:hypothetical protein
LLSCAFAPKEAKVARAKVLPLRSAFARATGRGSPPCSAEINTNLEKYLEKSKKNESQKYE